MKIDAMGKVIHGATLSRIEAKVDEEFYIYPIFTMQDLSRETGQYGIKEEIQEVNISKNKFQKNFLSQINMVVIGLTSYKAIVIGENHKGKLITSNFAIIEFNQNEIDSFYFTWYFNEHPKVERQLRVAMQGSIIRALSIQMLRELEIAVPPLDIQKKIGRVYHLKKRKEKLLFERNILEDTLYKQLMVNKLKEDIKCQ
ncbi:restriction endonuclease S subunit [Clostridium algifaecis]|uniref:Restriction endonuclease S subunit n=1 Tax=Clostridium algifaecis TaxID=1472040 RepID=A0ABS4KRS5_9CLOT|nr:restriction endonuclease subunit S [Clostridium algifaecis]MBP2032734.1 restriction endonuclease S subunit [Clostridium algifaecis]